MNWSFVIAQPYEPQRRESSRMASQSSEAPISASRSIKGTRFEHTDSRNSSRTPSWELSSELIWAAWLKRPSRFLVNCSVMGAHGFLDLREQFEVRGARDPDGIRRAKRKLHDGARAGGGFGKLVIARL